MRRPDRAYLRDRHARVREQLEQERLEVVVGSVDLVDEQHRRSRAGVLERPQERAADEVVRPEELLLAERRVTRVGEPDAGEAGADSSTRTALGRIDPP